jgi:hypothetical protein
MEDSDRPIWVLGKINVRRNQRSAKFMMGQNENLRHSMRRRLIGFQKRLDRPERLGDADRACPPAEVNV